MHNLTRRRFLAAVGSTAALSSAGAAALAGPVDDVLAVPAVDLHSHAGSTKSFDLARRMIDGRFGAVTLAAIADYPLIQKTSTGARRASRQPQKGELFAYTTKELDRIDQIIARTHMVRVLKPDDVAAAYAARKAAAIVAVEGCDFLEGDLSRVKWAYDRGVRHLQLLHYRVNELGDIMTEDPVHKGLTAFGADVVRECNRLGIIVDVAHAAPDVLAKVAEISKAPVLISHGGISKEPRAGSRMLSLAHAKPALDRGGAIGIWPAGALFKNVDMWAAYIAQMVSALGADRVAIGTDMEGGIDEIFSDYATYPKLVEALLAKRLAPADVAMIVGGNHQRIFNAVAVAAAA
jgi:membrane dipeptidase